MFVTFEYITVYLHPALPVGTVGRILCHPFSLADMLRATLALTVACLLLHSSPANGAKVLKATKDTVHWGFFSKNLSPKLEIESGKQTSEEVTGIPRVRLVSLLC